MAGHRTSILFSIACILLNLIVPCHACGNSVNPRACILMRSGGLVHGELAQRSKFLFSRYHDPQNATENQDEYASRIAQWLQHHDGSILAGSFMPDWYYRFAEFV